MRYLAAQLSASGKDVYASLMVALETFDYYKDTFDHPLALLEVVETAPMATNMVKVDAGAMAKDIASTGHAVLYGIYFDTGKDVINRSRSRAGRDWQASGPGPRAQALCRRSYRQRGRVRRQHGPVEPASHRRRGASSNAFRRRGDAPAIRRRRVRRSRGIE